MEEFIKRKKNNSDEADAIIEMDQDSFDEIMKAGHVNLGWRSCRVVHHVHIVHITRCFKCCGYGHVADKYTNKLACAGANTKWQTVKKNSINASIVLQ